MATLELKTRSGGVTVLDTEALEGLAAAMRGTMTLPADADYDEVRSIWNAMIDKRPGLITRCAGAADVMAAVRFAREHDVLFSVRGGGHNIAGNSLCEGGLLIDLSQMKSVRVEPGTKTARVEPGVCLGDLDQECQAFGLATPVGINSTTGIAGLTLGGGFGWLSRKHGLTIDNLLSADVVTADGEMVRASASSHPDLFWAIRGGGGNFGIVTSFEFELHAVGPNVLAGLIVHPQADAPALIREYRELAAGAPDELSMWVVMRKAPPLPFLAEEHHGTDILAFAVCYAGDPEAGERALAPLRQLGTPLGEHIGVQPFAGFQQAFDPLLTPGARNYWKTHNFEALADETIDLLVENAGRLPSEQSEIFVAQMGGATSRVAPEATAYLGREAAFVMNVHIRWDEATDDDRCVAWAREFFDATAPRATAGAYVNFMTDEEGGRVQDAYGANYERLVAVKERYDPNNVFRVNQNIRPRS